MLYVKTIVKESEIAGKGLFAAEAIKKGTVAIIFSHGLSLIPVSEYLERTMEGDEIVIRTACRYVHDVYICRESGVEDEDYVNHSLNPNLLYHCGICFAKRDIGPGEEMTANYQYILSSEEPGFSDSVTGRYVRGLPNDQVLYKSAKEMVALFRPLAAVKNRLRQDAVLAAAGRNRARRAV